MFAGGRPKSVFNGLAQRIDLATNGKGLAGSIDELHYIGDKPEHCDRFHVELSKGELQVLHFHYLPQSSDRAAFRFPRFDEGGWIETTVPKNARKFQTAEEGRKFILEARVCYVLSRYKQWPWPVWPRRSRIKGTVSGDVLDGERRGKRMRGHHLLRGDEAADAMHGLRRGCRISGITAFATAE